MKVIGVTSRYVGDEFPALHGREVRILAVLRGSLASGEEVDAGYFLTTDEAVAGFGGVKQADKVSVAVLRPDGSPGAVHWSAKAVDIECFLSLRG